MFIMHDMHQYKDMPTKDTNYMQLPYKSCTTYLTNHMGSYHVTSYNYSLRVDTYTRIHIHTHMYTDAQKYTHIVA